MTQGTGNQYRSRKRALADTLDWARTCLREGRISEARRWLNLWRRHFALVPASTRRRWRCGR